MSKPLAVIIGVGDGLSAAVARNLAPDYDLTLAARTKEKVQELAAALGAKTAFLDGTDEIAVRPWVETF